MGSLGRRFARRRTANCFYGIVLCYLSFATGFVDAQERLAMRLLLASSKKNAIRLSSPEETIKCFRKAVKNHSWADEYACYDEKLQSRFSYLIVSGLHELEDSDELKLQTQQVFDRYQVPTNLLERFPSMRSITFGVRDDQQIALEQQQHQLELNRRIELWTREVHSLNIDWVAVIDELEPLLRENSLRHEGSIHASQTGIVFHLDYHTFDRVTNLQVANGRAEGMIVARVRDPDIVMVDSEGKSEERSLARLLNPKQLFSRETWSRRVARPAQKISLIQQGDSWKIEAVPFR